MRRRSTVEADDRVFVLQLPRCALLPPLRHAAERARHLERVVSQDARTSTRERNGNANAPASCARRAFLRAGRRRQASCHATRSPGIPRSPSELCAAPRGPRASDLGGSWSPSDSSGPPQRTAGGWPSLGGTMGDLSELSRRPARVSGPPHVVALPTCAQRSPSRFLGSCSDSAIPDGCTLGPRDTSSASALEGLSVSAIPLHAPGL